MKKWILIGLFFFGSAYASESPLFPASLKKGDTVGLIASASTAKDKNDILASKKNLENMGFNVVLGRHVFDDYQQSISEVLLAKTNPDFAKEYHNIHINLAGSDEDRADDIMQMFKNPGINAIVEFRGGYGSARLLDLLDYKIIKKNPKIIIGYSDITALLLAINTKTGLVTFHGPMASAHWDAFTKKYFQKMTMQNSNHLVLKEYYPVIDDDENIANLQFTINSGKASGKMIGGNLSLITSLIGSPYSPNYDHAILFVEDVGEMQLYKLDRMFYQLKNAGILNHISGFVFASCYACSFSSAGYASLMQILDTYIKPLKIPAYAGSMIGHFQSKYTIPIGVKAEIDADQHSIMFLQSATRQ